MLIYSLVGLLPRTHHVIQPDVNDHSYICMQTHISLVLNDVFLCICQVARHILKASGVVDERDSHGCTPLIRASESLRPRLIAFLLASGADPTIRFDPTHPKTPPERSELPVLVNIPLARSRA